MHLNLCICEYKHSGLMCFHPDLRDLISSGRPACIAWLAKLMGKRMFLREQSYTRKSFNNNNHHHPLKTKRRVKIEKNRAHVFVKEIAFFSVGKKQITAILSFMRISHRQKLVILKAIKILADQCCCSLFLIPAPLAMLGRGKFIYILRKLWIVPAKYYSYRTDLQHSYK